uniref:Uncharacterized protein n=1 Tax=Chelonoidis abingdonii TaxID=106734 RepID=A0A8C0J5G6_CHEAB
NVSSPIDFVASKLECSAPCTKAATEYANGIYDIGSPAPSVYLGTFQILHLLEDLKMALEMLEDPQEREALRNQIPGDTARCIREWLEEHLVSSDISGCGVTSCGSLV